MAGPAADDGKARFPVAIGIVVVTAEMLTRRATSYATAAAFPHALRLAIGHYSWGNDASCTRLWEA
jgi:hypothetical protein